MKRGGFLYVKQGRPFICLQQNPFLFAWYVGLKYQALRLHALGVNKKAGLNGLRGIIQHYVTHTENPKSIKLPFIGQLALAVHRGYKVFDFKRKLVIRVIDQTVDLSLVSEEINNIRMTNGLECAPKILDWSQEKRWYVEEYVVGEQRKLFEISISGALLELFHEQISPRLSDIALFKESAKKPGREYIANIAEIIDNPRLSDSTIDNSKISKIKQYLNLIKYQLLDQPEIEIVLVLSHGDFSLVNILSTAQGIRVIDWEGAKFRGLLYDFYNFFLTEIYYRRADVNIADEVNGIAQDFSIALYQKLYKSENKDDISVQFYRRLYYLERISMLLERELSDKSLEVILRSIDVFQKFEYESSLRYQHSVDKNVFE